MSKFTALKLNVEETFKMPVRDESGSVMVLSDGTEAFIELRSKDSAALRAFDREATDARLALRKPPTAVSIEADEVRKMARATVSWRLPSETGILAEDAVNQADAIDLYTNAIYILEQVQRAVDDRSNFKKG